MLLLGLFAWRGDLRLGEPNQEPNNQEPNNQESELANDLAAANAAKRDQTAPARGAGPVVVRRRDAGKAALPRTTREGRVFDSMGFLLVGAEVVSIDQVSVDQVSVDRAGRPTGAARPAQASNKTDAQGGFSVELITQRSSDLLVRASGRRSQWLRTSAISPDPLFVRMEPEAPWDGVPQLPVPAPMLRGEGTILAADGKPLVGAFVNVLGSDCWGMSDASGRVELALPQRPATFVVSKPAGVDGVGGLAMISQPFTSPRTRGIVPLPRLQAESAGSIHGIVRDARGEPIAGLPVEVRGAGSRRRVQTQSGGVFVLSGLVPAEYEVEPFAYRGAVGAAVSLRVDRAAVACDLHLDQVEEANVRVVDENGAIAKGVWVAARLHGLRRGVDQVDEGGFVSLPVGADSEFDVRTADNHASCVVRQFDGQSQPATLVISQP